MKKIRAFFFGFVWWKRRQTRRFFPELDIRFCRTLEEARRGGLGSGDRIYLWGKREIGEIEEYARGEGIALYRVEDGFIRSVSLGSDLTPAYSLVADSRGIYFDPTSPSDLEEILNHATMDHRLLERAKRLRRYIVERKLSKYNPFAEVTLELPGHHPGQRVVMVPGQVEDDASIRYGAPEMDNLTLLRRARESAPEAYIVYKPHPDVLAGNRRGAVEEKEAKRYCDAIVTEASIDSVLERADEVHTMTSLVGFEALLRGKRVYTYGMPFYAGWGLTEDARRCERRRRRRSLDELVAASYILYPRYLDPRSGALCEVETLLKSLEELKARYDSDRFYRLAIDLRNGVSRKLQRSWRKLIGKN